MAIVASPTASLDFTWKDASGSIGHTLIHIPDATLAAVALTAAEALGALFAAMSDAVLQSYALTYNRVENAPAAPVAGSRVEEKGNFVWVTADGRSTRFSIPAIKDTQLNASGSVNRSAVATAAGAAGDGIGLWVTNKQIDALYATYGARFSWMHVAGSVWRRFSPASDSGVAALALLAAHARDRGRPVSYREEADQLVHEMYVW